VTAGSVRDGTPREQDANGSATALTSIGFTSTRVSIRAAQLLKVAGFDVLIASRRTSGCGVLLLVDSARAGTALETLGARDMVPSDVADYPLP